MDRPDQGPIPELQNIALTNTVLTDKDIHFIRKMYINIFNTLVILNSDSGNFQGPSPYPLHSPEADIIVHQQVGILLNGLLWQTFCDINDGFIVLFFPKAREAYTDSLRTE